MNKTLSTSKAVKPLKDDKVKLLDYIQDMSHEMSSLAEAADFHDLANVLHEVETVAKAAC